MTTVNHVQTKMKQIVLNVPALTICSINNLIDVNYNALWGVLDQVGGDNLYKLQPPITLVTVTIESVNYAMLIVSGVKILPAIAFTAKKTQPWSIQVPNVKPDLT